MSKPKDKHFKKRDVITFLTEVLFYAIFVLIYYLLVLHFSGGWLKQLFDQHRIAYAAASLILILVQRAVLEAVTAGLFKIIRRKTK